MTSNISAPLNAVPPVGDDEMKALHAVRQPVRQAILEVLETADRPLTTEEVHAARIMHKSIRSSYDYGQAGLYSTRTILGRLERAGEVTVGRDSAREVVWSRVSVASVEQALAPANVDGQVEVMRHREYQRRMMISVDLGHYERGLITVEELRDSITMILNAEAMLWGAEHK